MNKQGDKSTNLMAEIIIVAVIIVIVITIFRGQSVSTSKVLSGYIESLSEDFDGDRINDFYDASPCVAGEDIVISKNDAKAKYFFADKREEPCDKISEEYPQLEEMVDVSTGQAVCILPDKVCALKLKEFYDELRGD